MRKRKLLLVLATGAAFALSTGVGSGALSAGVARGTTDYPTTIQWLWGSGYRTDWILAGRLDTNSKCRALREVTLYKRTSSGWTQQDKILSSARGAWAFRYDADLSGPNRLRVTVTRDVRRNRDVVCEPDSELETITPRTGARTAAPSPGVATGTAAYPTRIHWRVKAPWRAGPPHSFVVGQLDTDEKCLGSRKVTMFKQTDSGYRQVDTVLSSARGAWGFLYETNYPDADFVRWTVTQDSRRDGSVICKGSTTDHTFPARV
jgi:hypothetical protein